MNKTTVSCINEVRTFVQFVKYILINYVFLFKPLTYFIITYKDKKNNNQKLKNKY